VKEILNAIEALLGKWLGLDPTAIVIFLVPALGLIYWRFKYYQDVLKSPLGLAGVRERLAAHGGWRKAYFGHLRRALAWVDQGLGPSAWSTDSYEFTLTMAFIYPFASLFIVWLVTGQNTSGVSMQLPEDLYLWRRALSAILLCVAIFLLYRVMITSGLLRLGFILVALVIAVAADFVGGGAVGSATSLASLVVMVVTIAGTVVLDGTLAVAVVVAFLVAGSVLGAVVVATAIPVPFTSAVPIVVAVAVFYAVIGVIVSATLLVQKFMVRRGLKGHFYVFYTPVMFCLLALICSHPTWFPPRHEVLEFSLIFWAILPLINSIYDWLSLASTRWLLNTMIARDYASASLVAENAIIGVGLGVLLLSGLAIAITAVLQTMNLISENNGGPEIFDLAGTLHRLRTTPHDVSVWWVYFTLFSTMLPTVFHATVASASFVTWRLPDSWKIHWLNLIDPANNKEIKDDHPLLVGMSWRLTAIDILTVILAAMATAVLAWLLFWLMPHEGRDLLWLCEKVAEWFGAPITV
jgi:hypothetical protein